MGAALLVVAALVWGGTWTARALAGAPRAAAVSAPTSVPAGCNHQPVSSSDEPVAQCFALVGANAARQIMVNAAGPPAASLGPADIRAAYKLPDGGHGQTVAIVDAFGDAHAESDLAAYRSHYGLPPCTTDNGCFKKVDQRGGANYPADDAGWGVETSLDLDAVSSACPSCNILLVQGDVPSLDDLGEAVDTAVALGAKFVSNSYGISGEIASAGAYDHYYDHPGVVVAAAAGDAGNVRTWPATDPQVVSVGGTTLARDASVSRGWTETAWASGGSGCSLYEPRPDYQLGVSTDCARRATSDISADADPATPLAVYDTLGQGGWLTVGGTSLATPLVTAMYALAGTPVAGSYPVTYPYHDKAQSSDLFDITAGTNGTCGDVLCQAGPGWDGPTGLGSPDGVAALAGRPQGILSGQVTDEVTGAPLSGAAVDAEPGHYQTTADGSGHYSLDLSAGSYTVTASKYGYGTASRTGVQITVGEQTTESIALAHVPSSRVSGTVTDGSGHSWALYAKITVPGTPLAPVYTDPFTGKYSLRLPGQASYTLHVTPVYGGYKTSDAQVMLGDTDQRVDVTASADLSACTAPGYRFDGVSQNFAGWAKDAPADGWHVTGTRAGWRFDDPGDQSPPPGGDDNFAIADSGDTGSGGPVDTALTSPPTAVSGAGVPHLAFDSAYFPHGRGQVAQAQLSTDGGRRWQTVWEQTSAIAIGHVDLPVPQASGGRAVEVRFRYQGRNAWWWSLDNVYLGTRTCVSAPGGLVAGVVTATPTGTPITGALVTATGAGTSAYTVQEPDDTAHASGLYWLFTPAGSQHLVTSAPGRAPVDATVSVAADTVTRQDFALSTQGS